MYFEKATGQHKSTPIIFDHYGFAQGFGASQVLCMEKTNDGFLWIGTEQGLLRYDGHSFKTYRSNPFDSTTISSNYIRKLIEDKHGRLWISALPDLNIFNPKTGKCKRISIPTEIDNEKKLNITCMKYDSRNDVMWFGTNKGLFYTQGMEVVFYREIIPNKDIASGIYAIELDSSGMLWLAANDGLWRYDPKNCTAVNFHRPNRDVTIPYDDGFLSLYYDTKNKIIWIGSWVSGLMKFDILSQKMSAYTFADKTKMQNGVLTINQSGLKGEDNILWLGTTDGVKTFDMGINSFKDFKTSDYYDIKGIPGAGFCFEPTKTEGMWIGTYRGLHRYDPYKQNVKVIDIPLSDANTNWILRDMCFESVGQIDSIIWFGISYHSFFRYDMVKKRILPIPKILNSYCEQVHPNTLLIDSKNILWLSSDKKGFVGYDLKEERIIKPSIKIGQKPTPQILKIMESKDGNLWLGSTSGMFIYHRATNEITEQKDIRTFLNEQKLSDYAFRFTISSDGKLWIFATHKFKEDDALYSFDPLTKEFKLYTQDDNPALKILKSLEGIASISNDKFVITSFNGFCVMNTGTKKPSFDLFETYNEKPLGSFTNITKDHKGNVWMSSDNGVTRYDPSNNSITNFTNFNSNMGVTPMPEMSFSNKTNTIYFSQNQAINSINIDDLNLATPGKVILSDMKILNYTFSDVPNTGQTLFLNYDQNSIDLQFSNLSFTNSQNNTYHYKLDGPQSKWISMTDNHLKFDNLGYGTYSLLVKAENSFGLKSPNEFALYINVAPPFWRRWWFNGFIMGFIAFLIYSFFKYRDIQREKLNKLRHNLARDLHDDMGSTLSHIKMMSEREAMRIDSNQSFKVIADKTTEVMSHMTEIIWSINPKNDSLKNVIGKIQEFAIDTLEPLGIDIFFEIEDVPNNISLNPEERRHFYLIFKEAINNTAKYSKASQVHFTFRTEKNKMNTTFSDNGQGFDPTMIKLGNGLKNMESRGLALKGILFITTSEKGTTVSLSL